MTFRISDLSLERDVSVKCYIWVTMTELDLNSRADGRLSLQFRVRSPALNLSSNSTQKCLEPPTVISSFVRQMQCTSHLHPSFRWKEQSLIFPPCRRHPFLCKQLRTLLFRASRLRQQRRPCRPSLIRFFELKVPAPIALQSNHQPPTLPSDEVTKSHFRFRLPSIPLRFKQRFAHLIYRRR